MTTLALNQLRSMATSSFIGRSTVGTGSPEVLDTTTVITMLGLGSAAFVATSTFDAAGAAATVQTNLDTHIANVSNPHAVTKTQVGLGNVSNNAQLTIANNLSDLNSASTARTNLGLGTLATQSGTFSGTSSGTNTGDTTLAGENYLTISSQVITAHSVDLSGTNATGTLAAGRFPALTGNVTTSAGSLATTIAAGVVSNSMLAGSIASSKLVGNDIATVGTITAGTWSGTVIGSTYGGTGVNNGSSTITLAGNLVTSGAFALTLTTTATTNVTLPTSGTLLANSRTISTTAPITGGGDLSANRTIAMPAAATAADGYLTQADWNTFNAKAPATVGFHPGFASGRYYTSPIIASVTSGTLTSARVYALPFFVPSTTTFTAIGCNVPATGGTVARLGIYNNSGGAPSTLLLDAGTVNTATGTGEKTITISQQLTAGWYWLALITDNNTASGFTTINATANTTWLYGMASATAMLQSLAVAGSGTALPSPSFGTPSTATVTTPVIFLKL